MEISFFCVEQVSDTVFSHFSDAHHVIYGTFARRYSIRRRNERKKLFR